MKWLDSIPLSMLIIVGIVLGLAPFAPEPHVVEKIRMLATGTLTRPIDIFDLAFHGLPLILLTLKLIRISRTARKNTL
jgi:hypothetical protein